MRTTTTQLPGREQVTSNLPKVGTQVVARPVEYANDTLAFQKLDQLRSSLSVFTQGTAAASQSLIASQQEADRERAVADEVKNPGGDIPEDASTAYSYRRRRIFADNEGLKARLQVDEEVARLKANPDELEGTDLGAHIKKFVSKLHAGVDDPVILGGLQPHLQRAEADALSTLTGAKGAVVKERDTMRVRDNVYNSLSVAKTHEERVAAVDKAFGQFGGLANEQDILNMVMARVSAGMENAHSAEEARAYANLLKAPIAAKNGLSLERLGAKFGAEYVSRAGAVERVAGAMEAKERADAATLEQEKQKVAEAQWKADAKLNKERIEQRLKYAKAPEDFVTVLADIEKANLDEGERTLLRERLQLEFGDTQLTNSVEDHLANGGYVAGELATKAGKRAGELAAALPLDASNPEEYRKAFGAHHQRILKGAPQGLQDFNKTVFGGASAASSATAFDAEGNVNPVLLRQIEAYGVAKAQGKGALDGIPPADNAVLGYIHAQQQQGVLPKQAIQNAIERQMRGAKPLAPEAVQRYRDFAMRDERFTQRFDQGLRGWVLPNTDLAKDSRMQVDWFINERLQGLEYPQGLSDEEMMDWLSTEFAQSHAPVAVGLTQRGNGGLLYFPPGTSAAQRTRALEAANALVETLREQGQEDVSLVPVPGYGSRHQLVYTDKDGVARTRDVFLTGGGDEPGLVELGTELSAARTQQMSRESKAQLEALKTSGDARISAKLKAQYDLAAARADLHAGAKPSDALPVLTEKAKRGANEAFQHLGALTPSRQRPDVMTKPELRATKKGRTPNQ